MAARQAGAMKNRARVLDSTLVYDAVATLAAGPPAAAIGFFRSG